MSDAYMIKAPYRVSDVRSDVVAVRINRIYVVRNGKTDNTTSA